MLAQMYSSTAVAFYCCSSLLLAGAQVIPTRTGSAREAPTVVCRGLCIPATSINRCIAEKRRPLRENQNNRVSRCVIAPPTTQILLQVGKPLAGFRSSSMVTFSSSSPPVDSSTYVWSPEYRTRHSWVTNGLKTTKCGNIIVRSRRKYVLAVQSSFPRS